MERGRRAKIPDRTVVEFACDADLNSVWEANGETPKPSQRITIAEAIVAGTSREADPADFQLPISEN